MSLIYIRIYKIIQKIPKGRVLTYGLISNMIDERMSAQGVGWAFKALGKAKRKSKLLKAQTGKSKKQNLKSLKSSANKKIISAKLLTLRIPFRGIGSSTLKVAPALIRCPNYRLDYSNIF